MTSRPVTTCSLLLLRLSDGLRRSMPDLARVPSAASVSALAYRTSAPRCLGSSWSFDSPAGLAPRQSSSKNRLRFRSSASHSACSHFLNFDPSPVLLQNRVHGAAGSHLSKATAYVSPTIKGPWSSAPSTPRCSLPRPAASPGTSSTPRHRVNQSARR